MLPIFLRRALGILPVVAVLAFPAASPASDARDGAGLELRPQANGADVGLPIYPGAVPRKVKDDDSSGLTVSAWGGAWGFKLAVLKLASPASIDKIASFYRDELGRYGDVLDCSQPHAKPTWRLDRSPAPRPCCLSMDRPAQRRLEERRTSRRHIFDPGTADPGASRFGHRFVSLVRKRAFDEAPHEASSNGRVSSARGVAQANHQSPRCRHFQEGLVECLYQCVPAHRDFGLTPRVRPLTARAR